MKWTEEYATGNAEIDRQHKELFHASDNFREVLKYGCTQETYDSFLEYLTMYCEVHFGFEENCMFAQVCPCAGENQMEHRLFTRIIQKETQRSKRFGFDPSLAAKLLDKVDNWLDSHILRIDVRLVEVLTEG